MKAVKRATCICGYNTNTDGKVKTPVCPKCSGTMKLSAQWYVRGQHMGESLFKPCGLLKKDADDFIAACRLAKRAGTILPGQEKDISWEEAKRNCSEWWDRDESRGLIRNKTRVMYRYQVSTLDRYLIGMSLLTISKSTLEVMKDDMSKKVLPSTVQHAIKTINRMYSMHLENLDLENEPRPKLMEKAFILKKVKSPEVKNTKTVSCTPVDVQDVLAGIAKSKGPALDRKRLRLAILMGMGMLLRPTNVCGLMWSEIDFANSVINIPASRMKGKRDFSQAVPPSILEELKSWRIATGLGSLYVFPSPRDKTKPMKSMYLSIAKWIKEAGLNVGADHSNKITPYILTKHTGSTQLYNESGHDIELVASVAHHADSSITRKRYVKNTIEDARRTIIPIQEAMLKRMTGQ